MKRIFIILALAVLQLSGIAQTPYSFNYQAVVRDIEGKAMTNKVVDFNIDVILSGQTVYSEEHTGIDTGTNGIVNFKIGNGSSPSGDFAALDWTSGAYKIRISMNGELLGISDITAVPIALYAVNSADNPWNYNSSDNTLSYTEGMLEILDLKVSGSSNLAPEAGMIRFDSQINDFVGFDGTEWKSMTTSEVAQTTTDTLWTVNTEDNSISYTGGLTELKDLRISGSSDNEALAGMIRYNEETNDFVGYDGTEWKSLIAVADTTIVEITQVDTLWVVNEETKSISYTEGLTELKDLRISGSSDTDALAGMIRYNEETNDFIGYDGTEWKSLTTATASTTTNDYVSDETELKAALAALETNIVIDTDMTITETINLTYAVNIESVGSPKKLTSAGITLFSVQKSNASIKNLMLNSTGGGVSIAINAGVSDVTLDKLQISGYERGIYKSGTASSTATSRLAITNTTILNSTISGQAATVALHGNIEDLTIDHLTIDGSAGEGLRIVDGCSGSISSVTITDTNSGGIVLSDLTSSSSPYRQVSLANVNVSNCSGTGITIDRSTVTASNIAISEATGSGVQITGSDTQVTPSQLTNLNISATKVASTNSYGVSLFNNAMANISNFYITGNNTSAVDESAIGLYANNSENFIINGGVFTKLGKLISIDSNN
ncbi:hypothetical protein [Mangrovibacterium sp.]|uniref:hypothetical protein n=1 Tax=Mangrovibacterium sp. TaxID=1961364 RepID=UPI0035629710